MIQEEVIGELERWAESSVFDKAVDVDRVVDRGRFPVVEVSRMDTFS